MSFLFLVDVFISTILIRAVLSVLIAYRGLLRLIFLAAVFGLAAYVCRQLELALSSVLVIVLSVPVALLLLVNILPEFRRLAQAILAGRFFWARAVPDKLVTSIASAVLEMGRQRQGALLVFTQRDDVTPFISGGEEVLAAPNKSLLLSIFNTKSPRHDGAVVIEGGQLVRIGAVLPLASAEGAHEEWGTRHLAAVGLTEKCDAQVMVVSEERGAISHTMSGKLRIIPSTEDGVRAAVEESLGLSVDRNRRMRRRVFEIFLWAMALLMSVVGSLTATRVMEWVKSDPGVIRSFPADIRTIHLPQGLSVDELKESSCTVYLRVPPTARFLGQPNLMVTLDLENYPPGPVTINLSRQMLNINEYEVDHFEPAQLKFQLVKGRAVRLGIKPILSGLRPELRLRRVRTVPEEILAEVRSSQWKDNQLEMAPIDLSAIKTAGAYHFTGQLIVPAAVRYKNGEDKIPVQVEIDVSGR
jgi:diadenylate cyclase